MNQNREIKEMNIKDLLVSMRLGNPDSIVNWNLRGDK
jgi:hypothetical protein